MALVPKARLVALEVVKICRKEWRTKERMVSVSDLWTPRDSSDESFPNRS
jgi:hypothetical protein